MQWWTAGQFEFHMNMGQTMQVGANECKREEEFVLCGHAEARWGQVWEPISPSSSVPLPLFPSYIYLTPRPSHTQSLFFDDLPLLCASQATSFLCKPLPCPQRVAPTQTNVVRARFARKHTHLPASDAPQQGQAALLLAERRALLLRTRLEGLSTSSTHSVRAGQIETRHSTQRKTSPRGRWRALLGP